MTDLTPEQAKALYDAANWLRLNELEGENPVLTEQSNELRVAMARIRPLAKESEQ